MELFASEFYSCDMMNWSLVIIVKENSKPAESRMDFDIWDRGINGVSKLNSVTKIKKIQNLQQYDIKSHNMQTQVHKK